MCVRVGTRVRNGKGEGGGGVSQKLTQHTEHLTNIVTSHLPPPPLSHAHTNTIQQVKLLIKSPRESSTEAVRVCLSLSLSLSLFLSLPLSLSFVFVSVIQISMNG